MAISMYDLCGAEVERRFSPFCWRAKMALAHKGLDVETVPWRFTEKDKLPQPNAGRVPVIVDAGRVVHDSTAIAEYLDETIAPRLHPEDPVERAINRAWTDYVPTFAEHVTGMAYADDEAGYRKCAEKIPLAFERVERALEKQGAGPLFNGAKYSLVDAAYAPFLQRYFFLDRIRPIGLIGQYPGLEAWADTLMKWPSTHSFPEAEFEALYRLNVKRRKKWLSQFVAEAAVAAA